MRMTSKSYGEELEIRKYYIRNSQTITVEIFKVTEGYKSFAYSSSIHHYDLTGAGYHEEIEQSIELAIADLQELMKETDKTTEGSH